MGARWTLLAAIGLIAAPAAAQTQSGDAVALQARMLAARAIQQAASVNSSASGASATAAAAMQQAQAAYAKAAAIDLSPYALKTAVPDLTPYALKTQIPDLSGYVLKAALPDLTPYALKAAIPTPGTTTPMPETQGGATGSGNLYALANHSHPRVTDSPVVYTVAGGLFSTAWTAGKFAIPPTVSLTWVNTTNGFMDCELTASPTTTGASGRCRSWTLTGLLTLGAGIEVHIVALPRTGS